MIAKTAITRSAIPLWLICFLLVTFAAAALADQSPNADHKLSTRVFLANLAQNAQPVTLVCGDQQADAEPGQTAWLYCDQPDAVQLKLSGATSGDLDATEDGNFDTNAGGVRLRGATETITALGGGRDDYFVYLWVQEVSR